MGTFKDITGQRFGRWTVIERVNGRQWKCVCDCGTEKIVFAYNLTSGKSKSCGCYAREFRSENNSTHKMTGTRIYRIWCGMNRRCYNQNDIDYKNYGGRGITVCDEWKDFYSFYLWAINNGYKENLSIDRKDNDGNYCPDNCRWATRKEQANNTRLNRKFVYDGNEYTESQLAEVFNLNYGTFRSRLSRGWSLDEAIEGKRKPKNIL